MTADDTAHVTAGPPATEVLASPGSGVATAEPPPAADVSAVDVVGRGDAAASPGRGGRTDDDLPVWSFRPRGIARSADTAEAHSQEELPFAPVPGLAPIRPQATFGPVGDTRSPVAVALVAVVTLGVTALAWHQSVNRELEDFDPKLHVRPSRSTVAVAIPWMVGLLVSIAGGALLVADRLAVHVPHALHLHAPWTWVLLGGLVAVPYLVLLLPFSAVAVVMTMERIRAVEEHVGTTTDRQVRPVRSAMLLALPIAGGLVLMVRSQRRLNAIWAAVAPVGRPSS